MRTLGCLFLVLVGCTDPTEPELECPAADEPIACPEGMGIGAYGPENQFRCNGMVYAEDGTKDYIELFCEAPPCSGRYVLHFDHLVCE